VYFLGISPWFSKTGDVTFMKGFTSVASAETIKRTRTSRTITKDHSFIVDLL
jgi:hypothetical protein